MHSLLTEPNKIYFAGITASKSEVQAALKEERSNLNRSNVIEKLELVLTVKSLGKPSRKPPKKRIREQAQQLIRARA